tara:strand:- start:493 stop:711 length:219 start_codon:yes stop_codon:yes gene_type:complete
MSEQKSQITIPDLIALNCDISDEILRLSFKGNIDQEDEDGNTSYTDVAQDVFNQINDRIEGVILTYMQKLED